MESINLILDVGFLLLGITAMVFVIVKGRHFDRWLSLLTCSAWVLKGIQRLYFDWYGIKLELMVNAGQEYDAILFAENTMINLTCIDALVYFVLFAAFVRLVLLLLFRRWYKKVFKLANK